MNIDDDDRNKLQDALTSIEALTRKLDTSIPLPVSSPPPAGSHIPPASSYVPPARSAEAPPSPETFNPQTFHTVFIALSCGLATILRAKSQNAADSFPGAVAYFLGATIGAIGLPALLTAIVWGVLRICTVRLSQKTTYIIFAVFWLLSALGALLPA